MNAPQETQPRFSIFHPVITYEHREFYEQIVTGLNGLFPICNQGKCTAVEISEDATEQEQLTDLMVRVENFSHELLDVTKQLFDQFYQAKEAFHRMILSTVAYVKINLIDRNLLERTCDVRWWALETAFCDCIEATNQTRGLLAQLCKDLEAAEAALDAPDTTDRPQRDLLRRLRSGVGGTMRVLTHAPARDAFRRDAAALKDLPANAVPAALHDSIAACLRAVEELLPKTAFACDRLEDINASYTLYRDLVICDKFGIVIANANSDTRARVLGSNVQEEPWYQQAMKTKDGNEYHAQDLGSSTIEDQPSLIYTTAIREQGDTNGKVIGAMGIFFDFQGESGIILSDYMPRDASGITAEGWYSFFTNEQGTIIASSDASMYPPGALAHVSKQHRLLKGGEITTSYAVTEGQESGLFTAKTDGYLEYEGLGWSSHLVLPKRAIFDSKYAVEDTGIETADLMGSRIIPEINKRTYEKIQEDKESIQLISLNGIVFASKLGKRGVALGPIFDQITKTGDFATSRMEYLLAEMAAGEMALNLQALEIFSKQAIDLIDRNLFERAADIRWWSTDSYFWDALAHPGEEKEHQACSRLKVINNSYTMYRNLILANSNGDIVACSQMELRNELRKINVSDQEWFQRGMRTQNAREFAVQDVQDSNLEKNKARSLIYSGGVRSGGARDGESIGVLAALFDWDTEASKILQTCLPRDKDGEHIQGCAAFYVNAAHEIIETTAPEAFPVGTTLRLPETMAELEPGASASGLYSHAGQRYILGSSRTKGYREYKGVGWKACIVRPM